MNLKKRTYDDFPNSPSPRSPLGVWRWLREDPCESASSALSVFYRRLSAFICVHLRLIFVSLSDRTRKIKFELFLIQEKIEPANYYQAHSCLNGLNKSPQSTQRTQSLAIPVNTYEKATASRFRTRMTRIARIFTDPSVSVSSAYLLKNKLQINTDERRFIDLASEFITLSKNIQF